MTGGEWVEEKARAAIAKATAGTFSIITGDAPVGSQC
jgi:hypothetical protein